MVGENVGKVQDEKIDFPDAGREGGEQRRLPVEADRVAGQLDPLQIRPAQRGGNDAKIRRQLEKKLLRDEVVAEVEIRQRR